MSQQSIPKFTSEERAIIEEAQRHTKNKASFGAWVAECALTYCDLIVKNNGRRPEIAIADLAISKLMMNMAIRRGENVPPLEEFDLGDEVTPVDEE